MTEANLKVLDIAKFCRCCRSTILNYERRGLILPVRDIYNARRYTQAQAEKLKSLLAARWPNKPDKDESHNCS